jgi:hypothetical protein
MYVAMHFAAAAQVLLFSDQLSAFSDQFLMVGGAYRLRLF